MLRTCPLLKRAIRNPDKVKRTYKPDGSKLRAVKDMLQSRTAKCAEISGGPILAGVLLERNPIVVRGGKWGNPLLRSSHSNEPGDEMDEVHEKWSTVQRIQDGMGVIFPPDVGIIDDSVLPYQQDFDYREILPKYGQRAIEVCEDSWNWKPNKVRRKMTEQLYFMVKGPNDTHWRFPTSGIVDTPDEWDLNESAVVARMFNGFSDGLDVTRWMGGEREDELAGVAAEAEKLKELEEKERLEEQNMTMKERRLRRRAAKAKKGGLDEEMNKQAKEVIPEYVSFQGHSPMGCLIDYELAQKTFLFRAFVIDVMAVRPQDWTRIHKSISLNLGYSGLEEEGVGWFTQQEIIENKMLEEEDLYIEKLLVDFPLDDNAFVSPNR
ncbi:hypothetical protein TL16_g03740 [Triparma laevis f. inornata]|uniref:Uncharacterized protein n=1 Tax=Triparma laevis f. inornata TaxID=1714386 RepID=A0A9W7A0T1_9STRA|nr:hypothetical protein TL16_g03740 [Triparma laevis f. inornata]